MKRSAQRVLGRVLAVFLAVVALSAPARAQTPGAFDTDLFRPQLSGLGLFGAESAHILPHLGVGFGLTLGYGHRPLVLTVDRAFGGPMVAGRLTGTATAALGLFGWLEAGAAVPYALFNDQRATDPQSFANVTGFGTARFQLKSRLLNQARHGIGVSLIASVGLPTGSTRAYLGESGYTFSPALAIERAFGPVRFLVHGGYTRRSTFEQFGQALGDELFYNLGLGWQVHDRIELGAELSGQTSAVAPFTGNRLLNPTELLVGGRLRLTENLVLTAAGGPGLASALGTPVFRAVGGLAYAPRVDTDGDGVPDKDDQCPNEPGPKENYGCPGPSRIGDRDLDGVSDDVDECPGVPGPAENNGCPWQDSDGDGVPDTADLCKGTPGWRHLGGCLGEYEIPGVPLFNAEGAETLPPWRFLYTFGFQYSFNPMVLKVLDTDLEAAARSGRFNVPQLNARFLATVTVGLGLPSGYQLSATIPVPIYPDPRQGWQREVSSIANLTAPQLGVKMNLFSELKRGFGLAFIPTLGLPTGSPVRGFPGQSGFQFMPTLAFEKHLTKVRRAVKGMDLAGKLACGKAEQLADDATDLLKTLKEQGKELADGAVDAALAMRDHAKAVVERAKDAVEAAKKQAEELVERAKGEAEKLAAKLSGEALRKAAEEAYAKAKAVGKELLDQLKKQGLDLKDRLAKKGLELTAGVVDPMARVKAQAQVLVATARLEGRSLVDKTVAAAGGARDKAKELWAKAGEGGQALLRDATAAFKSAQERGTALVRDAAKAGEAALDSAMKAGKEKYEAVKAQVSEAAAKARQAAAELVNRAQDALQAAAEKGKALFEAAKQKGRELVTRAKEAITVAQAKVREAVETAKQKGRELAQKLLDKGKELVEKAQNAIKGAMDKGKELIESAEARGREALDKARKTGEELVDRASDAVKRAKEKGQELLDAAQAKAKEALEEGRRLAKEAVARAKEAVAKLGDAAAEVVQRAKQAVTDAINKGKELIDAAKARARYAIEQVKQKGRELLDAASQAWDAAKEKAREFLTNAGALLKDAVEKAKQKAKEVFEAAKAKLEETWNAMKEKGVAVAKQAMDTLTSLREQALAMVANPTETLRALRDKALSAARAKLPLSIEKDASGATTIGFGKPPTSSFGGAWEAKSAMAPGCEETKPIPIRFIANLGYTVRNDERIGNLRVDDDISLRLGFGFLLQDRLELMTEANFVTAADRPFGSDERRNPVELYMGGRWAMTKTAHLLFGAGAGLTRTYGERPVRLFLGLVLFPEAPGDKDRDGDGVPDGKDRCPTQAGPAANDGCPWPDSDNDGVLDKDDKCPDVAGPRENGGCPWPDKDGDGVADKDDQCPAQAGPIENRGCPWPDRDGDGVLDKDDKCPDVAGPKENGGCPVEKDSDGDGVLDKDDKCPDQAGPKENGGCPWPDTDGDGVLDKDDRCPSVAGPKENAGCPWPDSDGDGIPDKDDKCPKQAGLKENQGCPEEIKITHEFRFAVGKATILATSNAALDEVADLLKKKPAVKRLEIQGHTDDRGSEKVNRKLSQRRAEGILKALVKRGIAALRLVPKGYGEDQPAVKIDPKRMSKKELSEARKQNRRVRFMILEKE